MDISVVSNTFQRPAVAVSLSAVPDKILRIQITGQDSRMTRVKKIHERVLNDAVPGRVVDRDNPQVSIQKGID